jgi:hypothetical protein
MCLPKTRAHTRVRPYTINVLLNAIANKYAALPALTGSNENIYTGRFARGLKVW